MQHDTTPRTVLSRRNFLYLTGLAATGLVAAACGGEAPAAATPAAIQPTAAPQPTLAPRPTPAGAQPTVAAAATRKEAPQLAQLVKDGKLPPLEQRLPKNPLVVKPVERIGTYGGAWRAALLGGADTLLLDRTVGYENLVRWDRDWKQIIPNVAESFTTSPDATQYTFKLREGLKWSDGQPYTADDITFWWEDIQLNKEITPGGPPNYLRAGGKNGTVEKVDQHTVRFTFAAPNGLFLQNLSGSAGDGPTRAPRHYLQQFHLKYNPQGVEQLAREANQDGWVRLFQTKGASVPGTPSNAVWQNKDLPRLHAWSLTTPYIGGNRVVAERNPYYFKIDPEGNQLPYLDRVTFDVAQDVETIVLKAANGEIEMQDRHIATVGNKAVFADNRQRGNYHFFETVPDGSNAAAIYLNWTHKDPAMRQIIQNKDFRVGLSHAIDRQEIIDVVYVGQGQPYQTAPRPESPFYDERFARQYTAFDLQKANEHLDKALPQKDGQGFRLGPDGTRFSLIVEIASANKDQIDMMNLVVGHWKRAGIEAQAKVEDRSLLWTRKNASEHDAMVWTGDGGLDVILGPSRYFPAIDGSHYAVLWAYWYLKDPKGEEPPAIVKQQMALYDQVKSTGDEAKQAELMKQLLAIAADQFYVIGTVLPPNGYGIVKNNFRNVPERMFATGGIWPNPAPTDPSQYFIES